MITTLVFDISNILHRTFYGNHNEDDTTIAGLAAHAALQTLNKYFRKHQPQKVVMAFDRKSWRKAYTASDECLSKKPYKGQRRQDMTPKQEEKYKRFLGHLKAFEELITNHTSILTLVSEHLEADDMIGGYVQRFAGTEEIILISTDSDYLQLLAYPNVTIISPATDEVQELKDFNYDAKYFLFTKCMRGDTSDNVQSAYPRVRQKRLELAYTDPMEYENLMRETWTMPTVDAEGNVTDRTFVVGELYAENQKLIDLTKQPDDIRELLEIMLDRCINRKRGFSLFHFLKFTGKYDLKRVREGVDQYTKMLSLPVV